MIFKINIAGLTRQQAEQQIHELMKNYNLNDDEEIKENYIIRQFWLPIQEGQSDIKIIYPGPKYTQSIELEELVESVTEQMKQYPDSELVNDWKKLVRSLKLRKLEC